MNRAIWRFLRQDTQLTYKDLQMGTIDFTPAKQDIKLYRRDDAGVQLQFLDVNDVVVGLTGATAIAQVRNKLGQLLGTLETVIDSVNNVLILSIPKENYATWKWVEAFYDLQLTLENGNVNTLLEGRITIGGDRTYE